ncbi:MAG: hypothetical protein LBI82_02335 [Dysgonamonadaceae bacterium]|jgi:hypothetical protein|nr:hypothetical protein [Dysgonamonadaceae bacterium]
MTQRVIISFVVTLFFATTLFAQAPTGANFSWNPEPKQPLITSMWDYTFLKGNENLFYYFQKNYQGVSQIMEYNAKANKIRNLPLKLKTEGVERDWRLVNTLNDTICIFSSFKNSKKNKYYFFVENVDINKFVLKNNPRMIAEIDYENVKGLKSSDFDLWLSDDEKHILISYTLQSKDGSILRYGFKVLDLQFNEIWKFEDDIPKVQGKWFLYKYIIDHDANVYMTSRAFEDPKDANKHYERSKLYVKLINKDGSTGTNQELSLSGDKFITAQDFHVNEKNELVCIGLYAKKGNESAVGNFSIVCNQGQTSIRSIDSRDFDKSFFTKGMDEKSVQKMEEKIDNDKEFEKDFRYDFGGKIKRKDGGTSHVIQKKKLIITTIYNRQTGKTIFYNFYYDDIIVLTYNAEGKIMWVQKIPQTQRLINSANFYGGYIRNIDQDDRLNFIYNLTSSGITQIRLGSVKKTVCLSLDKDGKESFIELSTGNDGKNFSPLLSTYLGDGKFLVGATDIGFFKTKYRWGVMTLE